MGARNFSELSKKNTPGNASGESEGVRYVDSAITSRRAIRSFTSDLVPRGTIEEILSVSSRAPSGSNMQPWRVYVVSGNIKLRLTKSIVESETGATKQGRQPWKYYPDVFPPEYNERRRKIGWDLYGLAGIKKGDREGSKRFRNRNFDFFGAPVGFIFTIAEELEVGSWLDYGCFLQNIMIAARGRGLHTCPQAIFAEVPGPIRKTLSIPKGEIIVCGMSLGYIDEAADVNKLETERSTIDEFTKFI